MLEKQVGMGGAHFKAGPDDGLGEGQFEAYASVFGNVDSYGDIVERGAFAKTLGEWEESGKPVPLLFGHNFSDPDYNIGHVVKAVEDERGLLVTAQLDLENPKSAQVYRMLKGRRIDQMSFAYDVVEFEQAKSDDGEPVTRLKELRLHEVSVVPMGANRETEILAVKHLADALKAGRAISAKNERSLRAAAESMRAAVKEIDAVLSANEEAVSGDEGSASGGSEAKSGASGVSPSVPAEEPVKSAPSVDGIAAEVALLSLQG